MVFGVVVFEGFLRHVRDQCVDGKRQLRQLMFHFFSLSYVLLSAGQVELCVEPVICTGVAYLLVEVTVALARPV